jgi:hypothetical protein
VTLLGYRNPARILTDDARLLRRIVAERSPPA